MAHPLPPDALSRNLAPGTLRRVIGGYGLAVLVASATAALVLASAAATASPSLEAVPKGIAILGLVTLWLTAFVALPLTFVPAVLFVVWSEYRSERRPILHILGGLGSSAFVWIVFAPQLADPRFSAALAAAGVVAGLTYWMLAGRFAGSWRLPAPIA